MPIQKLRMTDEELADLVNDRIINGDTTIQDLADELKIHRNSLSRWINGEAKELGLLDDPEWQDGDPATILKEMRNVNNDLQGRLTDLEKVVEHLDLDNFVMRLLLEEKAMSLTGRIPWPRTRRKPHAIDTDMPPDTRIYRQIIEDAKGTADKSGRTAVFDPRSETWS